MNLSVHQGSTHCLSSTDTIVTEYQKELVVDLL